MKQVNFPLWRIRKYQQIETNTLGRTKIKGRFGWKILDNKSFEGESLAQRRLQLIAAGYRDQLYPLNEQINYMRQLFKYKSGTIFVDSLGNIFKYQKTSKLNTVFSKKIVKFCEVKNWNIFIVEDCYFNYMVDFDLKERGINYASIMETKDGPFLYDLTKEKHEPYKRKI